MRIFTGQYERTVDAKNRIQIASQLRAAIDPERDGSGFFITLGSNRGTLSIYTERAFERLADRMETEFLPGGAPRKFEQQFYGLASYAETDKQGRLVLPELLTKKARIDQEVYLIGQKTRIDVWNRGDFERTLGIDWDGEDWPDWEGYLCMRPSKPS